MERNNVMMNVETIKSKRKTLTIEVKKDLCVIVRAPLFVSDSEIQRFIQEKSVWIEKTIQKVKHKTNKKNIIQCRNSHRMKYILLPIRH